MNMWGSLACVMLLVVACAIALHIVHAMKCADSMQILQVTQDGVSVGLLSRRSPIVVEPVCTMDRVANNIKNAGFMRETSSAMGLMDTGWYVVASEFVVICAPTACTLNLYHPSCKFVRLGNDTGSGGARGVAPVAENHDYKYVSIKLYPENVIVLPSNWSFYCNGKFVMSHVDSPVSRLANWLRT